MEEMGAEKEGQVTRRKLLSTARGALASFALSGTLSPSHSKTDRITPKQGGTLRFATSLDVRGLDPHRHIVYPVLMPLAAISQGLLDLNLKSEPVPGVASEWSASPDLMTYTFKLRQGVLFHNGREVDAASVKWNYERLQNPKTSTPFARVALKNLKEVVAVDSHTVRCHLHEASAAFPANVVYFPCSLMAPDSEAQAPIHPIGCGPFQFVKWERYQVTEMVRFPSYFETDAEGTSLPYLDRIVGLPKREGQVRFTALRTGEVELIDQLSPSVASSFASEYSERFQSWQIPMPGTAYIGFNHGHGPFQDKRIRHAAAHAINHEALLKAVFYGQGEIATGHYGSSSPWHVSGSNPWPQYDPEKARFLLRQAKAEGIEVKLQARNAPNRHHRAGELIQAMWSEVGFKVAYNIYEVGVYHQKIRSGDFHAISSGGSYRFDPDGWYSRQILSTSPNARRFGFRHDRADTLIVEARRTADKSMRRAIYREVESIINDELPVLYLISGAIDQAGSTSVQGYQPAISGTFSTSGGGIRTAWLTSL